MSVEARFLEWVQANGGWVDERCEVHEIPGMGRGIIAKESIGENEPMFTIPRTMLLNLGTSDLADRCAAAEQSPGSTGPSWQQEIMQRGWCPLIMMMLYEHWRAKADRAPKNGRGAGVPSTWGAYFDIMPHEFDTPMFWTDDELASLAGTDLGLKIGKGDAEKDYWTCVLPYIKAHAPVFVGLPAASAEADAEIDRWYSIPMYHRMGSSILSRSFHVKRDLRYAEADNADVTSAPAEITVQRNVPDEERADDDGADASSEHASEGQQEDADDSDDASDAEADVSSAACTP